MNREETNSNDSLFIDELKIVDEKICVVENSKNLLLSKKENLIQKLEIKSQEIHDIQKFIDDINNQLQVMEAEIDENQKNINFDEEQFKVMIRNPEMSLSNNLETFCQKSMDDSETLLLNKIQKEINFLDGKMLKQQNLINKHDPVGKYLEELAQKQKIGAKIEEEIIQIQTEIITIELELFCLKQHHNEPEFL